MANSTVYPYGTDGQLPSGIAIVNDLTTGGADKALSAEQGKVLKQMIEDKDDFSAFTAEIPTNNRKVRSYALLDTGNWGSSTSYKHFLIPVNALGGSFIVKQGTGVSNYLAWFTSNEEPVSGNAAPLVSGTERFQITTEQESRLTPPDGTAYLYVSYDSSAFALKFYRGDFEDNDTLVDTSTYTEITRMVVSDGTWGTSTTTKHIIIPCEPGTKVSIVANTVYSNLAWFSSNATPSSGGAAPLVGGTSRIDVVAGATWSGVAPAGTNYLYVLSYYSNSNYKPFLLWMDTSGVEIASLKGMANEKTFYLPMEMGSVDGSSGFPRINATTTEPATRLRSPNFVKFVSGNTLTATNLDNDETLYIRYYDANLSYISGEAVSGALNVPNSCSYIKAVIIKTSEFTYTHPLIVTSNMGKLEERKNGEERSKNVNIGCIFEVKKMPIEPLDVPATQTTYLGNNQRIWDRGYLQLPTEYRSTGKGFPLVLFCHGTNGFTWSNGTHLYDTLLQFYTHNGYVVADCAGMTAYYGTDLYGHQASAVDSKMNPLLMSCYASFVDWLCYDYNIDPDRIYVLSKSAGGLVSTWLCHYAPFKVRAVANLAPALVMAGQSYRVTGVNSLNFWLSRLGMSGHTVSTCLQGTGDKEYVLANIDKMKGFDPFFIGSDADYDDILTDMYAISPGSGSTDSQKVWDAYSSDTALMAKIDALRKYQPVPIKIWCAEDDDAVPYGWCVKYQEMVRRGSGICYLRTMPSGTGGHHSVDDGANAPTVSYACKDGSTITTPVAYAEALDWFEQW